MDNVKDYSYMALYALKEVDMMLESYRPLTASERFFMESEDGEDKAASGIVSKLKTAIAAIGKMIKAVLDFIKDKLVVLFADKDTKVKMQMIKAKIKENPALAKKKIDTIDLYKWAKEYEDVMDELDKLDGTYAKGKMSDEAYEKDRHKLKGKMDDLLWAITGYDSKELKGVGNAAGKRFRTSVSVDYAMRLAESNRTFARLFEKRLYREDKLLREIEKELGEKRTEEFTKEIHRQATRTGWHRTIVGWINGSSKGFWSATKATMKDCINAVTDDSLSYGSPTHMYGKSVGEKIRKKANTVFRGKKANDIANDTLSAVNEELGTNLTRKGITADVKNLLKSTNEDIKTAKSDVRSLANDAKTSAKEFKKDVKEFRSGAKKWLRS